MKNSDDNEKLSAKEIRDLVIKSGLETIPSIGPALSSAYFGYKQEMRFKRIESFYEELSKQINELDELLNVDIEKEEKKESISSMIEQLNDEVERESQKKKKQFFINFFIAFIKKDKNDDQDFLYFEMLKELSFPDLINIITLHMNNSVRGIRVRNDEKKGSINKLVSYGLVKKEIAGDNSRYSSLAGIDFSDAFSHYDYRLSDLGFNFYDYCLYSMNDSSS